MKILDLRGPVILGTSLLIASCSPSEQSDRGSCIAKALDQPELRNGVAAFTSTHGNMEVASSSWLGQFRLGRNTVYPAASLTKVLVAAEIKRLSQTGKLSLDAPVSDLLPERDFTGHKTKTITVRHLLQHTSGFGHPGGRDPIWLRQNSHPEASCEKATEFLLAFPTTHTPGEYTAYSNTGYCLLGQLLVQADAESQYAESPSAALRRALDSPLGGAGGLSASLPTIYAELMATLPLQTLAPPPRPLPDGSWYNYGWRWWPEKQPGAAWTHSGRLEGVLAIAITDGQNKLIVAHFDGDPRDYHQSVLRFGQTAWTCMDTN